MINRHASQTRIFWIRLLGVALVVFGLVLASAVAGSEGASAAELPCDDVSQDCPCDDDACDDDACDDNACDDDLCADDCPDCTYCHSIAPSLSVRICTLHLSLLPHSKELTPYASLAHSSAGPRLFKPPQPL